jgi:hypothetical protein
MGGSHKEIEIYIDVFVCFFYKEIPLLFLSLLSLSLSHLHFNGFEGRPLRSIRYE